MIRKADEFKNVYFRYRAKALVGLLKKFGKRRQEIVTLRISDIEIKLGYIYVTFTLVKKRKRGLAQYIKLMRKKNPDALNKTFSESGYTQKPQRSGYISPFDRMNMLADHITKDKIRAFAFPFQFFSYDDTVPPFFDWLT
jgi:integrase